MGSETTIAWCDHTFNPWWGCQRVSPGCEKCYAETWDRRWGGEHWGPLAERRFFGDAHWNEPLKWNRAAEAAGKSARVFCASMADVFEDRRDLDGQRQRLYQLIDDTPRLDWQLLTKRPEAVAELAPMRWMTGEWPSNVWLGVSVEDQERADERIPYLLRTPAAVRFLSCEPLLGPVELDATPAGDPLSECDCRGKGCDACMGLGRIDWVIVGGESGGGARPMRLEWARSLVEQCKAAGVACFCKQWGSSPLADDGDLIKLRDRKGGDPTEWTGDWPREFPHAA